MGDGKSNALKFYIGNAINNGVFRAITKKLLVSSRRQCSAVESMDFEKAIALREQWLELHK